MTRIFIVAVCLIAGILETFAQNGTKSVTYVVGSNGKLTEQGLEPVGSTAEYIKKYGKTVSSTNMNQLYDGYDAILTLKNYEGYVVKSLTMIMCSNSNSGSGTFSFKADNNEIAAINSKKEFNNWYNIKSYTNTKTNVKVTFYEKYAEGYVVGEGQDLVITISATVNSLYIYSYTITYEKQVGVLDMPRINPTKGKVFNRKQQINISCEENVDNIFYTLDGTEPTMDSDIYDTNVPLYIDKTTTVKAFAVKENQRTKTSMKTFCKVDNIKAIVACYNDNYYALMKYANNVIASNHLAGRKVDIHNDMFFCSPTNMSGYCWIFNDDETIQGYDNQKYLQNKDAVTLLDDAPNGHLWEENKENGLHLKGSTRYLRYISDGYFASYEQSFIKNSLSAPAYLINHVKGNLRIGQKKGKWGTMCLPYDVLSDDRSGAVYYNIVGKKTEKGKVVSIVLEEEQGILKAGQPYLFEATDTEVSNMYLDIADVDNAAEYGKKNGLVGCSSETTVESGMYILNENKIVKCGTGCKVKGNRAYINMDDVPEISLHQTPAVKRAVEMKIDNGTTGMVDFYTDEMSDMYYNMQGQRVSSPKKGLYIVNGKKVIVK